MEACDNNPWHRQFWPWFLIALPTVVVIACFYTVFLALHHPLSIVKEDYYKEGLAINQDQQRYAKAAQLQLAASCSLIKQYIQCEFTSGMQAVGTEPLQLQLVHPLDSDKDIYLSLSAQNASHYPSHYESDMLNPLMLENLQQEPRWYIYLESAGAGWAMQKEASLRQNSVVDFNRDK